MEVIDGPFLTSTMERVVFVVCQLAVGQKLRFISRSQTAVVSVCHCSVVSSLGRVFVLRPSVRCDYA